MRQFSLLLILSGVLIAGIGLLFFFISNFKLPGDFVISGKNFKIFIPLGTCLVLSVVLTLLLNFFLRLKP